MQSLRTILEAIARGDLSPREAVATSLDAIDTLDGTIHAFTARADRETVLQRAEQADGPLAGIAVGVKDIFDTHDLVTAYGSPIYAGHRPAADAAIVAMLRNAGASIAGKTVTTEFAFFQPGPTVNPHDHAHTPGGSSSGSVAAIAAGMIPAALGTQTGGSVIRPAAFCGVAGYKPGFRLVPTVGSKTFSWSLDTTGFFAATVDDVARFAALATGRALDPAPADPAKLRIGLYRTSVWNEAEKSMRSAVEHAAAAAQRAGATVIEIEEPDELAAAREIHSTVQNYEAHLALGHELRCHADKLSPTLLACLERGALITPDAYDSARTTARRARKRTTALFEQVDVLLTPSAPGPAPRGLDTTGVPLFNKLWTLTGNPCVNVPGLKNAENLPLGVQIVSRFARDHVALAAGKWLEMVL